MNNLIRCSMLFLPLFFAILISGCGQKQWRDPLKDKEDEALRTLLFAEQEKLKDCTCCIDANVAATWDSQLYDGGINGYLQIFMPSSVKLIAINPLGQPLFALTTDGYKFQTINAVKGVYKHGKMASFAERHSLPRGFFQGDWASWLTGRVTFSPDQLTELRQDIASRGIWLTIEKEGKNSTSKEHLLYDPLSRKIIERVPISSEGNEIARITYDKWTNIDTICSVPASIDIQAVSFGSDFSISLSDILTDNAFTADNFYLKLPPGYVQQYYP